MTLDRVNSLMLEGPEARDILWDLCEESGFVLPELETPACPPQLLRSGSRSRSWSE